MQRFLCKNESIMVGSVMISVLDVTHESVTLGITDPDAYPSYREEELFIQSDHDDLCFENDDTPEFDEIGTSFEPVRCTKSHPFTIHVL